MQELIDSLDTQKLNLLREADIYGANIIHYIAALNLYELIQPLSLKNIELNDKVKNTQMTASIIASLCGCE